MVKKTPCAYGAAFTLWQQAGNGNPTHIFGVGGEGFDVHIVFLVIGCRWACF